MKRKINLYLQLIRWDRPAGWLLLLWPTLTALWWAAGGFPGWHLTLVFVAGTILMRSAGCCVNDIADRHFDKHVARTQDRPVTTGAVSVKEALVLACGLALLAFILVLTTNGVTIAWSLLALTITIIYPYSKRFFAMPQAILGLAFSCGIPMAFAAVQGGVPMLAGYLVLANVFWVLAYDTEYAMVDRADDLKIGIRTSAITLGAWDVRAVMLFYSMHLCLYAALAWLHGLTAFFYLAWLLALSQIGYHFYLIRSREPQGCFQAFRINHWLGLTLFLGLVLSLSS